MPKMWRGLHQICCGPALPALYVVVASVLAVLLGLLTPPFATPDEQAHARRELAVAHGHWFLDHVPGPQGTPGVSVAMDANFIRFADSFEHIYVDLAARYPQARSRPDGRVSREEFDRVRSLGWGGQTMQVSEAVYPPFLYLPQAAAWRLAQAARLTLLHSLLLARLAAAFCSILLGWLALRLYTGGRRVLFAYLLLPTLLSLTASCSQDALLLAIPALVMALLSRAIAAQRGLSVTELAATTMLLAACAMARPPYLLLGAFLLVPALQAPKTGDSRTDWTRRLALPILGFAIIAVCAVGWLWAVRSFGSNVGPGADPTLQMAFLRAHPLDAALRILWGTARIAPAMALKGLAILGVNDVYPPLSVEALLLLSMVALIVFSEWRGVVRWPARAVVALALVAVVAGMSFAMYLTWTPPGAAHVYGLQPRYYLPLALLSTLMFSGRLWMGLRPRTRQRLLVAATLTYVAAVLTMPWVLAHRFYATGLLAALRIVIG